MILKVQDILWFCVDVSPMHTPHTLYLDAEKVEMGISILIQELELRAFNKAIKSPSDLHSSGH